MNSNQFFSAHPSFDPKLHIRKQLKGEIEGICETLYDQLAGTQIFYDRYLLSEEEFNCKHSPLLNENLRMTDAEIEIFELKLQFTADLFNSNQRVYSKICQDNIERAHQMLQTINQTPQTA
jgi:hypothetical protein